MNREMNYSDLREIIIRLMNGKLPEHAPLSAEVVYIENRRSFTLRRVVYHCDCGIYSQLGDWLEQCDWAALEQA
jgi:hypothetical protein